MLAQRYGALLNWQAIIGFCCIFSIHTCISLQQFSLPAAYSLLVADIEHHDEAPSFSVGPFRCSLCALPHRIISRMMAPNEWQ